MNPHAPRYSPPQTFSELPGVDCGTTKQRRERFQPGVDRDEGVTRARAEGVPRRAILAELHALLPDFRGRVRPAEYAAERAEVMVLTACFCDDTLDVYALEALLQRLKGHRRVFAAALGEVPGAA